MILLVNAAATLFMTGLIWFVQIVHYPLFAAVGREGFREYALAHSRLTTLVVAPVMLIELVSGAALVFLDGTTPRFAAVCGLGLIGIIWLSTAFLQIPAHSALALGFNDEAYRRLVATNWVRTAAWTVRAALVVWLLSRQSGN